MRSSAITVAAALLMGSCVGPPAPASGGAGGPDAAPTELTLMTHDSFALSAESITRFESTNNATLRILRSGDAGAMVNQAILSREHPLADVLYGVDDTFLSRALDAGIFQRHESDGLSAVPQRYRIDPEHRVTPIDYGDVCLNIDLDAFGGEGEADVPANLDDLLDPSHRGQLVVEDPATSSPGLAFLLATVARYGDAGADTWRDYWTGLRDNDALVVDGWEAAYYVSFSGGAGEGDRPIVVSYASSPAAEVVLSDPPVDLPSTAAILDGCYRQIEFAGVLAGTDSPELAAAFVDFLLSPEVQEEIPLQMFVYPVLAGAALPAVFTEHAQVAPDPLSLAYDAIGRERERWVSEWTEVVTP